jgi:endoglucanase
VRSARSDAPGSAMRAASIENVLSRYRRRRALTPVAWAALGTGVALAAAVALWLRANPAPETQLAREEHPAPTQSQRAAAAPAKTASVSAPELEPCTPAMRAEGNQPLIDDFEDADARIAPLERRAGFWSASNDTTGTQKPTLNGPLSMARIPGGRGASRFALHTSGGKFNKWGALIAADFSPRRCYDASAYAGLSFYARGRGSFNVVAKMTQVAPEEFGGSCTHDCYDTHRATITLSNTWQEQRVTWAELKQKGFGQAVPFDPRSLLALEFTVGPEQTPFDFWVDDVRFLER